MKPTKSDRTVLWMGMALASFFLAPWGIEAAQPSFPSEPPPETVCYCHNVNRNPHTICTSDRALQMGHQFHVNNGIDTPGECSPSAEPGCGDGVLDSGEACDNGEQNSDTAPDACRTDCTSPSCGDGVVDTGEQCDDGGTDPGDGCDASCRTESPPLLDCGNLVLEGDEQCECQDKTQGCSIEIAEVNEEFEACRGAATCTLCECQESLAGSESNLTAPAAGGCSLIRHR